MGRTENVRVDMREFLNQMPMGKQQWAVFFVCFAATAIEGFDTIVIGFIAPAISQSWKLSSAAVSPLVALGLFGLLIGSIVGGTLADRVGRKAVSLVAIAWFGIAAIASCESQSISQLIAWRFVTGLGIGAAMPATSALVAEFTPERSRATMLASMYCGFLFGAAAAGFVTSVALGPLGWRGMLLLSGVLPLGVVILLAWQVPESPLYLVASNKADAAVKRVIARLFPTAELSAAQFFLSTPTEKQSGIRALLGKDYRLGTLLTWFAEFAGYLVFFLIGSWLPTHLKLTGLSMHEASQLSSMFQFGALGGAILLAILVRRLNVAAVIAGAFGAGSLLIVALGMSETAPWYAAVVFLAGLAIGGPLICVNTIPGIFYPTAFRAAGGGWTVSIGRLGSIIGSALIGWIVVSNLPYVAVCVVLSLPLMLACASMVAMVRVLAGRQGAAAEPIESIRSKSPIAVE